MAPAGAGLGVDVCGVLPACSMGLAAFVAASPATGQITAATDVTVEK